jgi:hypothetical protein
MPPPPRLPRLFKKDEATKPLHTFIDPVTLNVVNTLAMLWDCNQGEVVREMCRRVVAQLTPEERQAFEVFLRNRRDRAPRKTPPA